jgi:hypothetical protein
MYQIFVKKAWNDSSALEEAISQELAKFSRPFEVVSTQTTTMPFGEMQHEAFLGAVPRHVLYVLTVVIRFR